MIDVSNFNIQNNGTACVARVINYFVMFIANVSGLEIIHSNCNKIKYNCKELIYLSVFYLLTCIQINIKVLHRLRWAAVCGDKKRLGCVLVYSTIPKSPLVAVFIGQFNLG